MNVDPIDLCNQASAKSNLLDFMEYCWLSPNKPLIIGIHTREICAKIDKAIERYKQGKSSYLHIVCPFRHGKALGLNTPIPTPNGWSTMGELKIGDKIYAKDGSICNVVAKSPVWKDRPVYKMNIDSGREFIIADESHEWETKLDRKSAWKIYDTKTLANQKESFPVQVSGILDNSSSFYKSVYYKRDAPKYKLHSIKAKFHGFADTVCIEVDSKDHLFLCGKSMIPTHNSDMSSRYLPAQFLGLFADREVMQVSYGADLSQGFSLDVKKIMESDNYAKVHKTRLNPKVNNMSERHIDKNTGKYFAVGADGGAAGKGSDLLIVDDFFKNRAAAESETTRKKRWESFTQDFLSRLAPVHIVLVLNTRWHVDDISGNILKRNNSESEDYVKDFPSFENIHYKARQDDGSYLFPERFSDKWYEAEFAIQGSYGAASLLQGNPTLRGGNMFKADKVKSIEEAPNDLLWVRFWDLASSEKERVKVDPDWTSGALVAYTEVNGLGRVYVKDLATCQAEAPARNKLIISTAEADGPEVWQGIESVAGYKDAYTTLKAVLLGTSIVYKGTASTSKIVRAASLEPIVEAGNLYLVVGPWNKRTNSQIQNFPACVHDDDIDAIVSGAIKAKERYEQSKNLGAQLGKGAVD